MPLARSDMLRKIWREQLEGGDTKDGIGCHVMMTFMMTFFGMVCRLWGFAPTNRIPVEVYGSLKPPLG